jgi:hypothetical protein
MSHIKRPYPSAMGADMDPRDASPRAPGLEQEASVATGTAERGARANGPDAQRPAVTQQENPLDTLFSATRAYQQSGEFLRLLRFIRRFPQYSPFNSFLLHVQNPNVTFVATAGQWRDRFKRELRPGARPLVILAPRTPVLFVFDLEDTEGEPLPPELENPFQAHGELPGAVWLKTMAHCHHLGIKVEVLDLPRLRAGGAEVVGNPEKDDRAAHLASEKFRVTVSQRLSLPARYATLVHELAHIWCGHLGPPPGKPRMRRSRLEPEVREFEAEAVSYLVCKRRGIRTSSEEYLAIYMRQNPQVPPISLHTVFWAVHKIEEMAVRFPPPEKKPRP